MGGGAERGIFLGEEIDGVDGGAFFEAEAGKGGSFIHDTAGAAIILIEWLHEVGDFASDGVEFVGGEVVLVDVTDGVENVVFGEDRAFVDFIPGDDV